MRILKSENGVIKALKNNDRDFELSKELLYNDEFLNLEKHQDIIIKDLNLLGSYINDFIRICEDKTVLVEEIIKQNITEKINIECFKPNEIIELMKNKNNLYIDTYMLYNTGLHKELFKTAIEYNYTYLFFNSKYGLMKDCLKDYKIILKENTANNLINLKGIEKLTNEYQDFNFIEKAVKTINEVDEKIQFIKKDFENYYYTDRVEFLLSNFDFIER